MTVFLAAIVTLVGDLAALVSLVVLHLLPTGLSPLHDPVSRYGISPYRNGYRTAAIALGIAGASAAVLLGAAFGSAAIVSIILLAVFALARLIIGWTPMDAPAAATTRSGRVHNLLAFAAFGTATATAFVAAGTFSADTAWHAIALPSTVLGIVMAVGSAGALAALPSPAIRRVFGAFERLIYVGIIAWLAMVAITAFSAG